MADLITTDKGFKVIHLTQEEARKAGWGTDDAGECLCSHCNDPIDPGNIYYPIVLNDTMCARCYMEWHNNKYNYKRSEDDEYEMSAEHRLRKIFKFE